MPILLSARGYDLRMRRGRCKDTRFQAVCRARAWAPGRPIRLGSSSGSRVLGIQCLVSFSLWERSRAGDGFRAFSCTRGVSFSRGHEPRHGAFITVNRVYYARRGWQYNRGEIYTAGILVAKRVVLRGNVLIPRATTPRLMSRSRKGRGNIDPSSFFGLWKLIW